MTKLPTLRHLSHLTRPASAAFASRSITRLGLPRVSTLHNLCRNSGTTRNPTNKLPIRIYSRPIRSQRLSKIPAGAIAMSTSSVNSSVHPLASSAFSNSGSSGLYDRARPSYPAETLNHIFNALSRSAKSRQEKDGTNGINVVELGSGTGIFTRLLLAPPSGVETHGIKLNKLVAVEPATGMRQGLQNAMANIGVKVGDEGVDGEEVAQVVDGAFDRIPVEDGWADAIIIAQAFHWSHGHYDSSLRSFARALRPGAPLILLWNLEDRTSPEYKWVPHIRDIYEKHEKGTPQYRLGWWKAIFDLPEYEQNFEQSYDYLEVKRVLPITEQGVIDRVVSKSYITALDDAEKQAVVDGVREAIAKEDKVWVDKDQGIFQYPYATDCYVIWRK